MFWGQDCQRTLELWARKAIEISEFSGLFCGSLEQKNVGSSVDVGGVAHEAL